MISLWIQHCVKTNRSAQFPNEFPFTMLWVMYNALCGSHLFQLPLMFGPLTWWPTSIREGSIHLHICRLSVHTCSDEFGQKGEVHNQNDLESTWANTCHLKNKTSHMASSALPSYGLWHWLKRRHAVNHRGIHLAQVCCIAWAPVLSLFKALIFDMSCWV